MHVLRKPAVEKLHNQLIHGRIGRRQFLQAAGAAGLAPAVASMTAGRAAAQADPTDLDYFTWSAYEVPELHQEFLAKYGASPSWSVFASAEDGLQTLRAGFLVGSG